MTDPLRSIMQTQHPELADELRNAIGVMQKVLQIAGPMPVRGAAGRAGSADSGLLATGEFASGDVAATFDSQASVATDVASRFKQPTAPELSSGEAFGRYQIVKLLGKGAMGAVYLAYDPRLERHVAIKIPILRENSVAMERFYIEARATATLRSPNICPVYDVADINGIHYISMAFIDGKPLTKLIDEEQLTVEEVAVIISKTARGVQKAHERGVIHRDIKPDNIMIDMDGEPVVMDFGLAVRSEAEDARLTKEGALLGSPAYMSPEQASGSKELIGPASDIYSLGVVLYQMLTRKIPFEGSIVSVLRQIAEQAPLPPSRHVPRLAGLPIERMCLKMMEKAPINRYANMAEVADAADKIIAAVSDQTQRGKKTRFTFWPFGRS